MCGPSVSQTLTIASLEPIVGPDVIIGAEIDPHSHLTEQRLDACDLIVSYKEFPHVVRPAPWGPWRVGWWF